MEQSSIPRVLPSLNISSFRSHCNTHETFYPSRWWKMHNAQTILHAYKIMYFLSRFLPTILTMLRVTTNRCTIIYTLKIHRFVKRCKTFLRGTRVRSAPRPGNDSVKSIFWVSMTSRCCRFHRSPWLSFKITATLPRASLVTCYLLLQLIESE